MPLGMLGKYERLDVLGHGASGIVYLAKDTLLGRLVALKEISAQGEDKDRVLGEARVLDRLRHPNIVQVVGVDEIGGKVVIAMEYVRGRSLLEMLRQTPQLPLSDAAEIVAQVCDGLAFAHAHRTVHRDVKPANILVGEDGLVRLVDFGLAEVLGTHSLAGGAGTYAYMAPEDFDAHEQSGRQSDIWAAGVVLYEALAGRRPFTVTRPKDPFAWKRAVEDDPLPPLTSLRPDAPPALAQIVARALARNPAERPADATDMARDLRRLEASHGWEVPALARPLHPPSVPDAPDAVGDEDGPLPASDFPQGQGELAALPGFPGVTTIDACLLAAPDAWEPACAALSGWALTLWLRAIGEEPLAQVAAEIAGNPATAPGDKMRDFLYRAGLETVHEARHAFADGERAAAQGRAEDAVRALRRAVHLDPRFPIYQERLARAEQAAGIDTAGPQTPLPPPAPTVQDGANDPLPILSANHVDFGALRPGQTRSVRVTVRQAGRGVMQGRVVSAPGWVTVEPVVFSTRQRQPLTLTADTNRLWPEGSGRVPASAAFAEDIVLEIDGARPRIAAQVQVLPKRRGFWQVALWYVPLLVCCLLPVLAGVTAPLVASQAGTTHRHLHQLENLWQPGFVAGGLLCGALFVLASAADMVWPLRLVPLGLLCLLVSRFAAIASTLGSAREEMARAALVQTSIPILVLLALQAASSALDPRRWGRWQVWRWIVGATGLFVSYALWHMG